MTKHIGSDLSGTSIKAGMMDITAGRILHEGSLPAPAQEDHDAVMARVAELIQDVIVKSGVPNDRRAQK